MSFQRLGHPLEYFKGKSESYVYLRYDNKIYDYGDTYDDNASFAELLVHMVEWQTRDQEYAWKIAGVLAKKLNIKRRPHKLTDKEYDNEQKKLIKELEEKK